MNHDDELIDALLKQQARQAKTNEADEQLLGDIEKAIDGEETARRGASAWRRALPLSAAALVALGVGLYFANRPEIAPELAIHGQAPGDSAVGDPSVLREEVIAPQATPEAPAAPEQAAAAQLAEAIEEAPPAPVARAKAAGEDRFADADEAAEVKVDAFAAMDAAGAAPAERDFRSNQPSDPAMGRSAPRPRVVGRLPEAAAEFDVAGRASGATEEGRDSRLQIRESNSALDREMQDLRRQLEAPSISDSKKPELYRRWQELDAKRRGLGSGGGSGQDRYGDLVDQPWKTPVEHPLSTFSVDVDTASYTNLRRMIREGRRVPADAVRIEECINYFDYRYPAPEGDNAFAVRAQLAECPWRDDHLLARVAIKGKEIGKNARPVSNLVFLVDVSGSMQAADKLPLLKRSMKTLVGELDERDRVGIVVYAGSEGVVLPPTRLDDAGRDEAMSALAKLEAGGSTNGGAGLARAYRMARENLVDGGVNRVILATDGDFNVGTTSQGELVKLVKQQAAEGVSLSVVGFGRGNLNDAMLEAITNDGNGNYFYIDGDREARRVFLDQLSGTLVTIAKDMKIQVEFNPGKVGDYRLIGYANRVLRDRDFNDDKVDAGDIGAGHTVTAFYEIVPAGVESPVAGTVDALRYQQPADGRKLVPSDDWFTLKLRYKHPEGDKSRLIETPVQGEPLAVGEVDKDFRLASAVALFGMKLRGREEVGEVSWEQVRELARPSLADDPQEQRAEFMELLKELGE